MTPKGHARQIIIRIPDSWTAWQLEWALDFLRQVEQRVWSIFEDEHLPGILDDLPDPDIPEHKQLELMLQFEGRTSFPDDEIPF